MIYQVTISSAAESWLAAMSDRRDVARIRSRITRMEAGNFGDAKSLGGGVSELRLDFGPGYRVYFARNGFEVVVVLCCGDKKSQSADIVLARGILKRLPE